jgi:hypothetical protein
MEYGVLQSSAFESKWEKGSSKADLVNLLTTHVHTTMLHNSTRWGRTLGSGARLSLL